MNSSDKEKKNIEIVVRDLLKENSLREEVAQLREQLNAVYVSNSWKITSPLRWGVKQIRRVRFVIPLVLHSIRVSGGISQALGKFVSVLRKGGLDGLKKALLEIANRESVLAELDPNEVASEPNIKIEMVGEESKKSVLVVSHDASRTGAPILSLNIVEALNQDYNVITLLLGPGELVEFFQRSSALVIQDAMVRNDSVHAAQFIRELCAIVQLDFAIANSIESRNVLKPLADLGIPVVGLFHEFSSYTYPETAFGEALLSSTISVFSTRLTLENALESHLDANEEAFPVVPQGKCKVPSTFSSQADLDLQKNKFLNAVSSSVDKKPIVIIGAGSVQIRKGVDLFIECAAQILRLDKINKYKFIWVGSGYSPRYDMAYSVYLKDQLKRAGLEDSVVFIGELSDMDSVYDNADMLLISSRLDPLPNVGVDALSIGLPVVCFDKTTGIADYLLDAELGDYCVARYLDPNDMAQKVIRLSSDSSLRENVAIACKSLAEKFFSMDEYIKKLKDNVSLAKKLSAQASQDINTILSYSGIKYSYMCDHSSVLTYINSWRTGIGCRKPIPGFHPGIYAEHNELSNLFVDPFADYLRKGKPSGPWEYKVITPLGDQVSTDNLPVFTTPVALHIHVYYPELLPEILDRLNRNTLKPDLYITVTSTETRTQVMNDITVYTGKVVGVVQCPNKGRNIGPLLSSAAEKLVNNYKYIGHIHTKKSLTSGGEDMGDQWRAFLLEHLIGGSCSLNMLDTIISSFENDKDLKIIYPEDPHAVGWTLNEPYALPLLSGLGVSNLPGKFNFPVGAMLWMKADYLKLFLNLNLTWDDYPEEPVPYDGSVLHAIERLFGAILANSPQSFAVTYVEGFER